MHNPRRTSDHICFRDGERIRSYELVIPKVHAGKVSSTEGPKITLKKPEYLSTKRRDRREKIGNTYTRSTPPLECTVTVKEATPPFSTVSDKDAEKTLGV